MAKSYKGCECCVLGFDREFGCFLLFFVAWCGAVLFGVTWGWLLAFLWC
jgi:hypothetical protein